MAIDKIVSEVVGFTIEDDGEEDLEVVLPEGALQTNPLNLNHAVMGWFLTSRFVLKEEIVL